MSRFFVFAVPDNCTLKAIVLRVLQSVAFHHGEDTMVLLVLEKGRPWVVTYDFVVSGRRSFHSAVAAVTGGADARVTAGRAGPPVVNRRVYQVAVENSPVRGSPHRLAVQFHLLLGVTELEGARPLVRWGLLTVRQRDGGRKVDLMLQVGVGGLEATESIPLQERRDCQSVCQPGRVNLRLQCVSWH